jgi:hypothetical protein
LILARLSETQTSSMQQGRSGGLWKGTKVCYQQCALLHPSWANGAAVHEEKPSSSQEKPSSSQEKPSSSQEKTSAHLLHCFVGGETAGGRHELQHLISSCWLLSRLTSDARHHGYAFLKARELNRAEHGENRHEVQAAADGPFDLDA